MSYIGDGRHLIAPRDTLAGMHKGTLVTSSATAVFKAEDVPRQEAYTWFHCEACNALVQRCGEQMDYMPWHTPPRGSGEPCKASNKPYTGTLITC